RSRIIFGNWLWPSRRRQFFSAASASMKIMASAVLFERHPLERTVRWRTVAVGRSQMLPVLSREVVVGGPAAAGRPRDEDGAPAQSAAGLRPRELDSRTAREGLVHSQDRS